MSDFENLLKEYRDQVNKSLQEVLPSEESRLAEAMRYSVLNGGKRLRPILVYLSSRLGSCDRQSINLSACAVELIHCYSLIHDDLPSMDNDDLRRGNPTSHIKFDEATAILAGDALQPLAFELICNINIDEKTKINTDEAWSYGKPDVPKLLNHFENYIKHLRKSGIAGSAIIETKKKQARDFEQLKSNAKQKNDPGELFIIGKRYFLGLGVEKNYLNALIWLNKAAYKNHSRAQFLLGAMYENGLGTEIDYVQAYKWFRLSMDGGFIEAKTHLNKLNLKISRLQRIKAQGIIQDWKKDNNFRN